jgi:hypothetical protein
MSFASDLLPELDAIRAIPCDLGLRDGTVTMVVRAWSGARVGLGTATTAEIQVLVAGQNPRITRIDVREAIASGGQYHAGDFRIGPVTPEFAGGGVGREVLQPAVGSSPTEVFWIVTDNGLPAEGIVCEKIAEEHRELRITFVLRATSSTL